MSPIWISKPIFSSVEVAMACWYFNIVLCFSEYSRLASHMVQWAFWRWSDSCVIQNHHAAGRQVLWPFDSFQNRVSADQNHMAQLWVDFFAKVTSLLFDVNYKFNNGNFAFIIAYIYILLATCCLGAEVQKNTIIWKSTPFLLKDQCISCFPA